MIFDRCNILEGLLENQRLEIAGSIEIRLLGEPVVVIVACSDEQFRTIVGSIGFHLYFSLK